jgi:hypothetical protein
LFFASAPQPVVVGVGGAGVQSLCEEQRLDVVPAGTFDPQTGAGTLDLTFRSVVFLGASALTPCPVCLGDPTANDGVRGGTCSGGPRNGLSCDAHGIGSLFGVTSLHCPASPGANVTGAGLPRDVTLSTTPSTLTAADACDAPLGGFLCHCGACSLDPSVACQVDADCAGLGLGTCASSGGAARQPNDCNDASFNCEDQGDDKGRCDADGPDEKWCDAFRRADGSGVVPCTTNADCSAASCPGGCGNCTFIERRRCFLPTIVARGDADPITPVLAGVTCTSPTASASINFTLGLPGPQRLRFEAQLD